MLIRTQDKRGLYNLDNIKRIKVFNMYEGSEKDSEGDTHAIYADSEILGKYSSLEVALDVVTKVQNAYVESVQTTQYYNREVLEELPYVQIKNTVFEMP